jgi:hypothetical protein
MIQFIHSLVRSGLIVPVLLTLGLVSCLGTTAAVQAPRASQAQTVTQQLFTLLAPVEIQVLPSAISEDSSGTREVLVRWVAASPSSTPEAPKATRVVGVFSLGSERRYASPPPRQRSLELRAGHVLVAGLDSARRLKSWTVIPDPRIVRSEGPGEDGVLTGQTLYFEQTEFLVAIPDDPQIVELRIYEPQTTKASVQLTAVGAITLSR